jgi:hypothetical protein
MQIYLSTPLDPGFTHHEAVVAVRAFARQKMEKAIRDLPMIFVTEGAPGVVAQSHTVQQLARAVADLDEQIARQAHVAEEAPV